MDTYFYQDMLAWGLGYNERMHCYAMLGLLSIKEYQERVSYRYRYIHQLTN